MILIKSGTVYEPSCLGEKNILIAGDRIEYISSKINLPDRNFPEVNIIDAKGLFVVPGIIDLHVHITGGGGEGGYATRTPELMLSSFTLNGVTTCIGLLGTDGTTRSMQGLIAKARALEIEGISTFIWTGSYEFPTRTLTDTPRNDIILIDKVIGIGELAISDHRSSHPSEYDLERLASEARVGGMLSGKCGILHFHIGDEKKGLEPVFHLVKDKEIPMENLLPTHVNRNKALFQQSVEYARTGGHIDITSGIKPEGDDAVHPVEAYKYILQLGIDPGNVTMSSDAGGSLPFFDDRGRLIKLGVGTPSTQLEMLKGCAENGIPLENALIPFTSAPASFLKLRGKGYIHEGYDADLLLLDRNYKLNTVISKGKVMVSNYKAVAFGTFE